MRFVEESHCRLVWNTIVNRVQEENSRKNGLGVLEGTKNRYIKAEVRYVFLCI